MSNLNLRTKIHTVTASFIGISPLQKKIISGGTWAVIGKVTLSGSGLLLNAILARLLSVEELGAYFLAISILSVVSVFILFGLNQTIVRLIAEAMASEQRGRARQTIQWTFIILSISCLFGLGFMLLGGGKWITEQIFESPLLSEMIILIAIWMVLSSFQILLAETFRGFHDIRLAASFGGGGAFTRIILLVILAGVWFWRGYGSSLNQIIIISIIANLLTVSLAVLLLTKRMKRLPKDQFGISLREILTITAPFWINGISLLIISQADVWFLGAYQSVEQVAIYGAVLRLILLATTPTLISSAVLPPIIAELHSKGEKQKLERTLRMTATLIAIPASIIFALFFIMGGEILALVYGEYYRSGYLALAILSIGQWGYILAGFSGMALMMSGYHNTVMKITVITGIFSLGLMYLLTPVFSYNGLAVAVSTTILVQNVLMLFYTRKKIGVWTHISPGLVRNPKSIWKTTKLS